MNLDDIRAKGWIGIDELVDWIDERDGFGDDFLDGAVRTAKKAKARQMVKTMVGDDGSPLFASVVITDDTGHTHRIYKQEALFNASDYVSVIAYHDARARHHSVMAKAYRERGERRFGNALYLFDPDPVMDGAS